MHGGGTVRTGSGDGRAVITAGRSGPPGWERAHYRGSLPPTKETSAAQPPEQQAGGSESVVQVADDGSGDDDARGTGQTLDQTHADKHRRMRCEGAHDSFRYVYGQAGQEGTPSAEGVAERADDHLDEGYADHEGGQGSCVTVCSNPPILQL